MNTQAIKQQLQDQERTLQLEIARLADDARAGGASEVRDYTDQATASQEVSEAFQEEALVSRTLAEVQDALKRIADRTYGKCLRCGCEIPPSRLQATPAAAYCAEDQELLERTALPQLKGLLP